MVYAAKRAKNRCPTHPGALLRDDMIPATGRTKAEIRKGARRKVKVPEAEWIRVQHPELRIVPQPLWDAAQARKAATFATYRQTPDGRLSGKPDRSALASKYLLAGMLRCGVCGGKMVSLRRRGSPGGKLYLYYVCWTSQGRGAAVCNSRRMVPMGRLHDMVVTMFQQDILTAARLEQVIRDLARTDEHGPARAAEVRRALEADLHRVEGRIANLTEAVAAGGEVKSLIAAIRAAEGEQQDLRGRLEHADGLAARTLQCVRSGRDVVSVVEEANVGEQALQLGKRKPRDALVRVDLQFGHRGEGYLGPAGSGRVHNGKLRRCRASL